MFSTVELETPGEIVAPTRTIFTEPDFVLYFCTIPKIVFRNARISHRLFLFCNDVLRT